MGHGGRLWLGLLRAAAELRALPYHSYTYYNCGGAYYQPQYEGDTVVYVSVPDPAVAAAAQ